MPSSTRTTTVRGYEMEITFDWHKATKGMKERGTGFKLEPDEDAGIDDITSLRLVNPADFLEIVAEEVTITLDDVREALAKMEEESA
jgi:hypothetical protein